MDRSLLYADIRDFTLQQPPSLFGGKKHQSFKQTSTNLLAHNINLAFFACVASSDLQWNVHRRLEICVVQFGQGAGLVCKRKAIYYSHFFSHSWDYKSSVQKVDKSLLEISDSWWKVLCCKVAPVTLNIEARSHFCCFQSTSIVISYRYSETFVCVYLFFPMVPLHLSRQLSFLSVLA